MPTCPNGHQSGSDHWCEVCGAFTADASADRIPPPPPLPPRPAPAGSASMPGGYGPSNHPPAAHGPAATARLELCPRCQTPREPQAPFCRECHHDFRVPSSEAHAPLPPPLADLPLPPGFPPHQPQGFGGPGSQPAAMDRPAEPLAAQPAQQAAAYPQAPPAPAAAGDFPQAPAGAPGPPMPPAPPIPPTPPGPPFGSGSFGPPPQPPAPQPSPPQPPAPQPSPPQPGWVAVIAPDRQYFTAMMARSGPGAAGLDFPASFAEQRLALTGIRVTIGRRRHSTGEFPDIDLSRPQEDPGVSHQHAVLLQQADGSWSVMDKDSTNGTTLNGGEEPLRPYVPVPLKEGDRVHVGAWTTIMLRRDW